MIVTSAAATFTFTSCSGTSWYGCYPSHSYNNTWPTSSTAVDVDPAEHAAHDDHDTVQHRNNNNKHIQHLGGTRNPPQHNHQHSQEHQHRHYTADDNDNNNDNGQDCVPARMVSVTAAVDTLGHRYSNDWDRRTDG